MRLDSWNGTRSAGRLWLGLAVMAQLSGCQPEQPKAETAAVDTAAPQTLPPGVPPVNPKLLGKPTTLTVWLAADYAGEPMFAALNQEFEAAYPGVKVKLLGVPWPDVPTKVKTAIIGGKPPDIAHHHPFALGAQGFAEPLDDLWKEWGRASEFLPGAMQDASWRGHTYGMPLDINCTVLIYNRDLFAKYGLKEPGADYDYPRWQKDLAALTTAGNYGLGLATGGWHTYAFVLANGGELIKEEGGKIHATFTDPKTVEAVRFLTALGTKYHYGPTPTTKAKDYEDATTLFTVGKVGMIYTGPWDFENIKKNAPTLKFGVTRFPAGFDGVRRGSVQGGGGLFIPRSAANRELAFEWMKWAVSDRYATRLYKELGRFPVRQVLYKDPSFAKDPHIKTFAEALPHARPFRLEAYPQAQVAFEDAVKAAFYGADPVPELEKAQRVAQLAIDATEGQ